MTERKPPGVSFETWVDQQIREAMARGEFDNLPGAGEPIRDLDKPYDVLWVMRKLRKENVPTEELLPTPLRLRAELERLSESVHELATEDAVRDAVRELNLRILQWLRTPTDGPRVQVGPLDVERMVRRWHAARQQAAAPVAQPTRQLAPAGSPPTESLSGWKRLRAWARNRLPTVLPGALRRAGRGGPAPRT